MADTATGSLTVAQSSDPYKLWNSADWFDNVRWGLTGTEVDSDFKAGLWWKDAEAMNAMVPDLRHTAQQWQNEINELQDKKQSLTSSRQGLEANRGVDAARTQSAYDDMIKAIDQRITELSPVPNALNNAADIVSNNAPKIAGLWAKWENDRANFEACHQDTVAMQPIISDMARAFLSAADATQKPFANALGMPEITIPKGDTSTLPKALQNHLSSDAANTAQKAAATTAGTTRAATNTTPGVVAGGAGHAAGASATPQTTLAGVGGASFNAPTAAGTGGLLGGAAGGGAPSFAGSGVGSFAGGGAGAGAAAGGAGGLGGFGGAGGGAGGAGGGMPMMPGAFGGAGAGRSRSTGEQSGVSSSAPTTDDFLAPGLGGAAGSKKRKGSEVKPGVAPLIGGGAGRVGARGSARIRPGDAARPRSSSAGVAEGLLGRAANDAEFDDLQTLASTRRRRSTKRREGADTLEFLDEDAWQTDDPGSGVVDSEGAEHPGSVAGSTI